MRLLLIVRYAASATICRGRSASGGYTKGWLGAKLKLTGEIKTKPILFASFEFYMYENCTILEKKHGVIRLPLHSVRRPYRNGRDSGSENRTGGRGTPLRRSHPPLTPISC